jgi:hypothetical protein
VAIAVMVATMLAIIRPTTFFTLLTGLLFPLQPVGLCHGTKDL